MFSLALLNEAAGILTEQVQPAASLLSNEHASQKYLRSAARDQLPEDQQHR